MQSLMQQRAAGLTKVPLDLDGAINFTQVLEARADGIKVSLSGDRK
ncbi:MULTISPECIES: hypothetical protein [Pseudomonas]|nr:MULTISPECIES: hypothetical protein [Pseudomonas]MBT2337710.1 hypothetical protein [Pseudomonas fluorescens]MCD4528019.1 hypothetical protein [Pseudomonas sp. C3-2018]